MRSWRGAYRFVVPVVAVLVAAAAAQAGAMSRKGVPGSPAGVGETPQPVFVVLDDQHDGMPATATGAGRRAAATRADQRPLVDAAQAAGAQHIRQFSLVNGFAAIVSTAGRNRLAADPRVRAVLPDRIVRRPAAGSPEDAAAPVPPGRPAPPVPGACPASPAKPLLQPEALQLTHTAAADSTVAQARQLATGKGVTVAFIADGLDIHNPDLTRKDGSSVVVDYRDFTGDGLTAASDGREAFGDASAIAAQGRQTYDLADYVNQNSPLPHGCTVQIRGVAPDASLVALKAFGAGGLGTFSAIVQSVEYAVTVAKVDVINESLGNDPVADNHVDPLSLANRAAVAAGITVVAASGDSGIANTVGNPAGDPQVISVGAATSLQLFAQGQPGLPGVAHTPVSGNVASLSSGGITENATVDDLLAPGDAGWALCSTDPATYTGCANGRRKPSPVVSFGGTSQAAPLTAGAAALVIQAYAAAHQGKRPSPALIKRILVSTATDGGDPADRQGSGLLNALDAVRAAKSIPDANGTPTPTGDNLLVDHTQLSATALPGTAQHLPLTVTNVGAGAQTITAHTRVLTKVLADQHGSVTLDATSSTAPTWTSGLSGTTFAFVVRSFSVPAGTDHLDASIAFPLVSDRSVSLRLIDPHGAFVQHTDPQGPDGFGHTEVHAPAAGTWTAVFDSPAVPDGFHGKVSFDFVAARYTTLGSVSPASVTLQPGQKGTFRVNVSTPGQPGDLSAAVQLDTAGHRRLAVPVTLRSLIPTATGHATFTGTLTGGNGRIVAQTVNYRFDVPAGVHDFGLGLTLTGNPDELVFGMLESPDGQLLSQQCNVTGFDANGDPVFGNTIQEFRRDPEAGRWTLVVFVFNPVAGTSTSQPFTGDLRFNVVDASATGLPASTATVLPAGKPVTATVTVRNTGTAPQSFFVDPRSSSLGARRLVADAPETDVPVPGGQSLHYLVPTETVALAASATATAPVELDLDAITDSPEVMAAAGAGRTATAAIVAPQVQPGPWRLSAVLLGPFGSAGTPAATANFTTSVLTKEFDAAVTSSTGDVWLSSVRATPPPFTPMDLSPGGTGVITVTITPSGKAGTAVSGFLYVDDFNAFSGTGDELVAIPYAYTVGASG